MPKPCVCYWCTCGCAGDTLDPADCRLLVQRLQETQLCFSCAHGRPTIAPLADLRAVRRLAGACGAGATRTFSTGAPAPGNGPPSIDNIAALCDKMNIIVAS